MEKQEDIFEIRVNENGKENISHIYPLMKLVFWVGLAVEIIILVNALINYSRYRNFKFDINRGYHLYMRIYTIYIIVISVLVVLQSFYFLKFTGQAHESIKTNDNTRFNNSFSWMYKSLWMALIAIIVNGLFYLYIMLSRDI